MLLWGNYSVSFGWSCILWSQLKLPFDKPTFGLDKELLTLALPAAGERLMMRAGDVVIIALVVSFGTEAVAGNAVGEVLTQFNYMPAFGALRQRSCWWPEQLERIIGKE